MLYANYIRNKMRHLVKIVFASGYPLKVISRFRKKAAGYTIHGKTEIGKNLIPYPYAFFGGNTTKTVNGITFTENGDGTITLNGTSTLDKYFSLVLNNDVYGSIDKTKTYTISMQGGEIGKVTIMLALRLNNKFVANVCTLSKPTIDFASYSTEFDGAYITLTVEANASFDNVVVKPQLELGDTATEYEPYTEYGVGDKTKNLIPYPYYETTVTRNGITFTDNGDGSITVNGTAQGSFNFTLSNDISLIIDKTKTYILTSNEYISGKIYSYLQLKKDNTVVKQFTAYSSAEKVELLNYDFDTVFCGIHVSSGLAVNNLIFKPQLISLDDETNNLIPYPYATTTRTENGVTFTDNGDGTVTVNGTATANTWFQLSAKNTNQIYVPKGIYIVSGGLDKGTSTTIGFEVNVYNGDTKVTSFSTIGNNLTVDITSYTFTNIAVYIYVPKGATVENLVFKPKLISLGYEPYGYKIPLVNVGKNLLNIADITITQTNSYYASRRYTDIHKYFPELEYCKGLPVIFKAVCSHSAFEPEIVIAFSDNSTLTNRGNKSSIISKDKTVTWIEIRGRSDSADYNGTSVTLTNIQLELGSSATEYEPYRAPDTTNVYHNAQLKDGESINYKADDLPELQLYKGENNITADTAVTPSAIDIKYLN